MNRPLTFLTGVVAGMLCILIVWFSQTSETLASDIFTAGLIIGTMLGILFVFGLDWAIGIGEDDA